MDVGGRITSGTVIETTFNLVKNTNPVDECMSVFPFIVKFL